eukprot:TRINITY_DN4044_c0_g1_i2.p1 TRINITY_DN4044_c0_g1~~TRINITY_DN4044_c0_g1_i2.p1  ORF type:complete len:370 (+),score=93.97 TRINITY_DN4044_c0_g1_i2:58-1110(+)
MAKRKAAQENAAEKKPKVSENEKIVQISQLESAIMKDTTANVNHITSLLDLCSEDTDIATAAIYCLQRVFAQYALQGDIVVIQAAPSDAPAITTKSEARKQFESWLQERFSTFFKLLLTHVRDGSKLAHSSLRVLMKFVAVEGQLQQPAHFVTNMFSEVVNALLQCGELATIIEYFADKYLCYDDVRYHTLAVCARLLAQQATSPTEHTKLMSTNALGLLLRIAVPADDDLLKTWLVKVEVQPRKRTSKVNKERSAKSQRKVFQQAWLAALRLPLDTPMYKTLLTKLHKHVLPYLASPLALLDFLSESYDVGGIVSILALNALFVLITKHNLDYPSFYTKLYALLTVRPA